MYESYWGIQESPFLNAFQERWFVGSSKHDEALARMLYVVEHGLRCGVLTGAPGTGKSLLMNLLVHDLLPVNSRKIHADLAGQDSRSLSWQLAGQLHRAPRESANEAALWRQIMDELNGLAIAGERVVIIVDHVDAGDVSAQQAVERLLHVSCDGTGRSTMLLACRKTTSPAIREASELRIELGPLESQETADFIRHKLSRAGCEHGESIFDDDALSVLHGRSKGIPRDINRICELSLLAAMGEQRQKVGPEVVHRVAEELLAFDDAA